MNKKLNVLTLSVSAALVLLAGCESPSKVAQAPAATLGTGGSGTSGAAGAGAGGGATASGTPQSSVSTVDLASRAAASALMAAPTQRVVYFDFDSFVIKDEFKNVLDGHAKVLARENGKRMVIEGHTDERGGREYNLALGQKRAEAVVRSLALLGAPERQLEAVSFGEERPATAGSDEAAWSKNRRAELKDR